MEPGDRKPAPGSLRLVQELVNTRDVMERTDVIATLEGLRAWAVSRGLLDARDELDAMDHHRVADAREALRALLLEHNGATADPGATYAINAAADDVGLTLRFADRARRPELVSTSHGADRLLGTILIAVYEASQTGQWQRLKACREPTCRWAFYDHSRNSRSRWCTMSMCGGRAKSRAYRQRKRGAAPAAEPSTSR